MCIRDRDPLISLFQKKDALQSLYHSLPGLMPIFIVQGAAAFDINDLPLLESFIQRLDHSPETGEHIIHIIAGFMDTILIKFKNPIVMDFRRELILFQTVPFYTAKQSGFLDPCISMWRDLLIRIMEAIKNQQLLSVYNYTKNFFDTVKNAVDNFLDGLPEASELKPVSYTHLNPSLNCQESREMVFKMERRSSSFRMVFARSTAKYIELPPVIFQF